MDYSELQSTVLDWLNRPDLTDAVVGFIADAEARLNRDTRLGGLTVSVPFTINADALALPDDLRAINSWSYDGTTYYGEIETVDGGSLARLRGQYRDGAPRYVAIMDRKAYFAPVPTAEYDTVLSYFLRVPALSDVAPTNWLLDEHQDIYRLAALVESAPYLQDDARLPMWERQLDERLNDFARATEAELYSGSLVRRINPIG